MESTVKRLRWIVAALVVCLGAVGVWGLACYLGPEPDVRAWDTRELIHYIELPAWNHPEESSKYSAAQRLSDIGTASVPPVVAAVRRNCRNRSARYFLVRSLGNNRSNAARGALRRLVQDGDVGPLAAFYLATNWRDDSGRTVLEHLREQGGKDAYLYPGEVEDALRVLEEP